jgi:hypothetical protein
MVIIQCEATRSDITVDNTVHMCAERRLIQLMKHRSRIEGVSPAGFAHWFHRKVGRVVILRIHCSGTMGTSIPCILCRKVLTREYIDWEAHIGTSWHSNRDVFVPPSKFTPKQLTMFHEAKTHRETRFSPPEYHR